MDNQKGAAPILAILLLLAGLGVGVYLIQKPTNILPKAYNRVNRSVSAPITPSPRPTRSPNPSGERRVDICHKTGAVKNPYVAISIDQNALEQHQAHSDIYPVPETGCPK